MQLESCRDESGRFDHYLQKTFMKTASLMAYSCQAVSFSGVVTPATRLQTNRISNTIVITQEINEQTKQVLAIASLLKRGFEV